MKIKLLFFLLIFVLFSGCSNPQQIENTVALPEATNTYIPSSTAQEQFLALYNKAVAITNQPGWIHVKDTVIGDSDQENNGVLPDGTVIPKSYTDESWFHINTGGLVFESLTTMFTLDGKKVQTSILHDNNYWNTATDKSTPQSPYSLGSFSGDFPSILKDYVSRTNKSPLINTIDMNGRSVILFSIGDPQKVPLTPPDFKQPVISVKTNTYFDSDTGFMVQRDEIMTLTDGTVRILYAVTIDVEIGSSPPEEIISQIQKGG
jgi:hypothetical protein